jgi:hypothetical protein
MWEELGSCELGPAKVICWDIQSANTGWIVERDKKSI